MTSATPWWAVALASATLALASGCANVRLQSAEQAAAQGYSAGQFRARADCIKRSGPTEATRCQRQSEPSYDDYTRAREQLRPPEPAAAPIQ